MLQFTYLCISHNFQNDELVHQVLCFPCAYLCQSTARSSSTHLSAPYNANQDMPKPFQIPKSCPCRQPGQLTRLGFKLGRRPFCFADIVHGPP